MVALWIPLYVCSYVYIVYRFARRHRAHHFPWKGCCVAVGASRATIRMLVL